MTLTPSNDGGTAPAASESAAICFYCEESMEGPYNHWFCVQWAMIAARAPWVAVQ